MEKTNTVETQKNLPDKRFKAGSITATVWLNNIEKDGKLASYSSITLERSYKDKDGNWQTTNSFRSNDLPKLALVAQKAYEHVMMKAEA
ncbi:hypothetical protein H6503_01810 [Candidatus Woesearchaeota archaeon]|nr:hypothetical protein [Candidatus Woesearchaeota archaeon]